MDINAFMAQAPDVKPRWVLVDGDINTPKEPSVFGWSASQVGSFDSCNRAWYFDKIERRPRVEKMPTYFGSRFHEFREGYFYDGKIPDPADIPHERAQQVAQELVQLKLAKTQEPVAEAHKLLTEAAKLSKMGLVHLPMPNMITRENVERSVDITTDVGIVRGYVDFFLPDQGAVGYWPRETKWWPTDGVPLVGDHKTTSSTDYIKDIDTLINEDPQPAIYGKAGLEWTGASQVDFLWHYNVKKGRKQAVPVRFRMQADQILERFSQVEDTARKMLDVFQNAHSINPSDVTPNPEACDNYGGCPHRDYCPLTNQEKLGAIMNMNGNGGNNAFEAEMQQRADENGNSGNPALQAAQNGMQPNFGSPPPQNGNGFMQAAAPAMNPQQMQNMPQGQQQGWGQQQPPQQNFNQQQQSPQQNFNQQQQPPQQNFNQQQPPQQNFNQQQPPQQNFNQQQPPQQQAPTSLAAIGQEMVNNTNPAPVNPPDAAAPDLDVTPEELKAKAKAEKDAAKPKKLTKAEKEFRAQAALQILLASVEPGRMHIYKENTYDGLVEDAIAKADILIRKL